LGWPSNQCSFVIASGLVSTSKKKLRTARREGERRTLRVDHRGMFFQATVDRDGMVSELRELLWAADRALDRE
jgi:hypothetical protein